MMLSLRGFVLAFALATTACASAPASAPVAQQAAHERILPLEGVRNFRDIGGYETGDGRHVKWGHIYRSAELSHLSAADIAAIDALNIHAVFDLRSTQERASEPTAWTSANAPQITAIDYDLDRRAFAALARPDLNADIARDAFAALYPDMLLQQRPQQRALFEHLLADDGATLYHCTAGKDRTGLATALILSSLGVPRETILADYMISDRYAEAAANSIGVRGLAPDVARVFGGVDARYLETTFAYIDAHYGSVDAYLDRELGVDAQEVQRLRALYTE